MVYDLKKHCFPDITEQHNVHVNSQRLGQQSEMLCKLKPENNPNMEDGRLA